MRTRAVIWLLLVLLLALSVYYMIGMPGKSFAGRLPDLTEKQKGIKERLGDHIRTLASDIGERNIENYTNLELSANYIEEVFASYGYSPERQTYQYGERDVSNIEVEIKGGDLSGETVVIGAHYDSVWGSPGANDNASGVACVLELARLLAGTKPVRTIRFVAFVNEEAPYFETEHQGSYVYARRSRERGERVTAMISVETVGYYSDEKGTQKYPFPFNLFYPKTANFVGFVGNLKSRNLVHRAIRSFRDKGAFPSEGVASPEFIEGVGWSDHNPFWQFGYSAIMVTDTAFFRYEHYHTGEDTPDKIDYGSMARIVEGLRSVVIELADD